MSEITKGSILQTNDENERDELEDAIFILHNEIKEYERQYPYSYHKSELYNTLLIAKYVLKEKLDRENPKPLTIEELKQYANKPYYHVSLQREESKWGILPDHVAKNPQDYHYGERWLAYAYEPKEVE